jgi:thioredoxin 1
MDTTTELYYFTAPWCVPCKTFGPVMDTITGLPVKKVDVDQNPEMATMMGVMSVPTVVIVQDGKDRGRFSGARDAVFVNRFIASFVKE